MQIASTRPSAGRLWPQLRRVVVAGLVVACLPVAPATADTLVQNFDTGTGWKQYNNSSPLDTGHWRIGGLFFAEPFNGPEGSLAESGYDAISGVGTLSSWLASPVLSGLTQGDTVSFYTRRPSPFLDQPEHPDRLEVRISTSGSCHPGTGPTSVGDFTTLLLSVNPTLVSGVYPAVWTQYQATLPPMTPSSGCVAFRHFVTDAGVGGANGHYVGVDQLEVQDQSDNVRPETTIVTGPSGTAPSSVSFSYSSSPSAGVGGYQCRLTVVGTSAPGFHLCGSGVQSYEDLADDSYRFEVRAVSYGGNIDSSPASQEFVVDGTPPDTTITAGPSGAVATNDVTFGFAGTPVQDVDGLECRLRSDGNDGDLPFAACGTASEQRYDDLDDGDYTFEVRARDAVGNVDVSPAAREFTVDTVAPDTEITAGPAGLVASGDAVFAYGSVVEESGVTFECRMIGQSTADPVFASCTAMGESYDLADGEHRFEVRAKDAIGNVDATPAVRELTVDTIAPQMRIVSGPAAVSTETTAVVTYESGTLDDLDTVECRLVGRDAVDPAFAVCPRSGSNYTDLAVGGYRFEVRGRDLVGNFSESAVWVFRVDAASVPPVEQPGETSDDTSPVGQPSVIVPPIVDVWTPVVPSVPSVLLSVPPVTGLGLGHSSFRAARSGRAFEVMRGGKGIKRGTVLRLKLDRTVRVEFRVERKSGRRWRRLRGVAKLTAPAGATRIAVRGRFGGKTLRPGTYRLRVTLIDPTTGAKTHETRQFRIRR